MRETKSTNPELLGLISFLKKQAREKQAPVWLDVAENLSKPSRQRVVVNLSAINRNTKRADVVVVPGKVLGMGRLGHALTVAAFDVSEAALGKLKVARAKVLTIPELVEKNPQGSNVKIMK